MIREYSELSGFDNVYLEGSFVLGMSEQPGRLEFDMEVALCPGHVNYGVPKSDEQYCYKRGKLAFPDVTSVEWVEKDFSGYKDASGEMDYGNIDGLTEIDPGWFEVFGDWGHVRIYSSEPEIHYLPE